MAGQIVRPYWSRLQVTVTDVFTPGTLTISVLKKNHQPITEPSNYIKELLKATIFEIGTKCIFTNTIIFSKIIDIILYHIETLVNKCTIILLCAFQKRAHRCK